MAKTGRFTGPLLAFYENTKEQCFKDLKSTESSEAILTLVLECLKLLQKGCTATDLKSLVADKEYFSFVDKRKPAALSRPINKAFFEGNPGKIAANWKAWEAKEPVSVEELTRLAYTMAMAYFAAVDLFDRNNKKGPATYFECLIGHLFARTFQKNPTKSATIEASKRKVKLTMDFLFDLGENKPKIHLPVKTSTRERVVQAWAHQRILDASYGNNVYKGLLVVFSETKLDLRKREVVEICVPDQWLAYQTLIAKMDRIYYFDTPQRYEQLAKELPDVFQLKHFSAFFTETEAILKGTVP